MKKKAVRMRKDPGVKVRRVPSIRRRYTHKIDVHKDVQVIKSDLTRLDSMTDDDIAAAVAADPDAAFIDEPGIVPNPNRKKRGRPRAAVVKVSKTVRYDKEVLDFFEAQGKGWQTKMNEVLLAYVHAHKD
jgi:uncharacterized protein (DUF4415 family)